MKSCDWCLWLGSEKVFDIRKLRENFDTAVLVGYYLGGGLENWLSDAGETAVLEKVREIDRTRDIGTQLEFIFGVRPDKKETPTPDYEKINEAKEYHEEVAESVKLALAAVSSEAPQFLSSFSSSYNSSFTPNSFTTERILRSGSFINGSFRTGSFTVGSFKTGYASFRYGSFRSGSFRSGSFRLVKTSFSGGSFTAGSFRMDANGSFRYFMGEAEITKEEYRRTRINLSSCPLNGYGYGIHKI